MICTSHKQTKWRIVVLMIFLNTLAFGCSPSKNKNKDAPPSTPPANDRYRVYENEFSYPDFTNFSVADSACFNTSNNTTVTSAKIFRIKAGVREEIQTELVGVSSSTTLTSRYIAQTSFGMSMEYTCGIDSSGMSCMTKPQIIRATSALVICKKEANYPDGSIEAISLSAFVNLHQFFQFYDKTPGRSAAIPSLNLLLLPNITLKYPDITQKKRDNLTYYPTLENKPTIAVLPKGDRASEWNNMNLWESPWIISHEGSHHIFRSHMLQKQGGSAETASAKIDLIRREVEADEISGGKLQVTSGANALQKQIYIAINEAFADLYGFIASGADSQHVNSFKCFEKTRDPSSAVYGNGQPKVLTEEVLKIFFSGEPMTTALSCKTIDYRDPYAIATIITYAAYTLYYAAPEVKTSQTPLFAIAALTLQWVNLIDSTVRTTDDPRTFLFDFLTAVLKATAMNEKYLTSEQCTIVRNILPVFSALWLDGTSAPFACP